MDYSIFFDTLLAKNRPFAAWSLPGKANPEVLIGQPEDILHFTGPEQLDPQEGFVFAPFRISPGSPLFVLRPGIYLKDPKSIASFNPDTLPAAEPGKVERDYIADSFPDYISRVQSSVNTIKKTSLSKVILSRIIPVNRGKESVGKLFRQLHAMNPNAFVYLVNLSPAGLWMGATPEALLQSNGKTVETVSLAGTQMRKENSDYCWNTKEIEEQAFVSRYMLDVFYRFGIYPYSTTGPESVESGQVAHLKTSFRFSAKKIDKQLGHFVAALHPTPAVCGLPKEKADQFIRQTEKHDRRYYTGYLGPWRLDKSVRLFVNLRCMEITEKQYLLYSGGGITARSVPEAEWAETNNKAQTLLSAIEKIQKKTGNRAPEQSVQKEN